MRMKLMVVGLLAACALAISTSAEPTFSGKFTLPFDVHWGGTLLPAGNYSITMERFESAALVRSANGKSHFVAAFPTMGDSLKGRCFLYITGTGGQYTVRYLNAPSLGRVLIYAPLTKTEHEELARGNGQALPIVVAAN